MTKFWFVYFFLAIISFQAIAQEINYDSLEVMDYSRPRDLVIADVQVSGIEYIQKEVLISISGLKNIGTITTHEHRDRIVFFDIPS